MRRSIRIAQVLCEAGAGLCLALAVLLFSASPAQAACFGYCTKLGDCYATGIGPACTGVTCVDTRGYLGCGDCLCLKIMGTLSDCGCQ